jgi:phytanoyl-CoA dioxygenase PhyH
VLARLLGPIVHISRDFHAQFKCGATGRVGYGGYDSQQSFMEVHGAYQLHQDFTGASLPTSPSALILWTGLNDCEDWPVRIYPRSHRLGLLCRRFVSVDHASLTRLGEPLEIQARPGSGIIFNSLLLHGTGSAGPGRRVSCDIRFFPSCPYLQSLPRSLVESPAAFIEERLARETGETLRAPLLENQAIAACMGDNVKAAPHSILNWANYLNDVCNGDPDRAADHLARFANAEIGLDSPGTYIEQFHGRPMQPATLERIREFIDPRKSVAVGTS